MALKLLGRKLCLGAFLLAVSAAPAAAQFGSPPAQRAFVSVNAGFQGVSQDFTDSVSFPIYGSIATATADYEWDSGPLFDISGGAWVWNNVGAAVGFTRYSDSPDVAVNASVPSPFALNRPRSTSATVPDVTHSERAIHLQAVLLVPFTSKADFMLSAGPSFFSVEQKLVPVAVGNVSESPAPSSTVSLTGLSDIEEDETAVGFNIGIDATYLVTRNVGGGIFMRYARAGVDVPLPGGGEASQDVGGFQMGFGVRVRF